MDDLSTVLPAGEGYRFCGLRMVKNATLQGRKGTMRVDNLIRFKPTGVADVALPGVRVFPNPAAEYIVVSADTYVQGVELINAKGQTVVRNATNYVNVNHLEAGVYVLKVHMGCMVSTHKVVVPH